MNTWPSIRREAALALSPGDVAAGIRQLDILLKSAARSIRKRDALFILVYVLGGSMLVLGIFAHIVIANYSVVPRYADDIATSAVLLSTVTLVASWWGWHAIQHKGIMQRFGRLTDTPIPEPLAQLITSFANSSRDVRTASGVSVRASLFASQWAIMLFSEEEVERKWVRSPSGARQKQEIFARPLEPELSNQATGAVLPTNPAQDEARPLECDPVAEAPLRNSDPAMDWLVGGTSTHHAAGQERFLDTLPPHQVEAYRLVLTVARRELRKGGQPGAQEEAIRIILAELDNKGLRIRGTSRATIMKLIHGQHRRKDIRGYFI